MFKIKYKFLFIYNVIFNTIGFCLIFPLELAGRPLYLEDIFPVDIRILVAEADARYDEYQRIERVIKNSYPWIQEWRLSEYELEEARVNKMAHASGLSLVQVKCERQAGKSWGEICLEHMVSPAKSGIVMDSRFEHMRENDWFLWRCYYSPQAYARRQLQREFAGYNYFEPERGSAMNGKEFRAIILNFTCPGLAFENEISVSKTKVIPPSLHKLINGGNVDLAFYCDGHYSPRAVVMLSARTREVCLEDIREREENALIQAPERSLNYTDSAGIGSTSEALNERSRTVFHSLTSKFFFLAN